MGLGSKNQGHAEERRIIRWIEGILKMGDTQKCQRHVEKGGMMQGGVGRRGTEKGMGKRGMRDEEERQLPEDQEPLFGQKREERRGRAVQSSLRLVHGTPLSLYLVQ